MAKVIAAAYRPERGGADFVVICTNTMHRMADQVQAAIGLPMLHISDPTAERIKAAGPRKVSLLGMAFTMEQDFYKGWLAERHSLEVLVPDEVKPSFRLVERGAKAVILARTEITLVVQPEDSRCPCPTPRPRMPRPPLISPWRHFRRWRGGLAHPGPLTRGAGSVNRQRSKNTRDHRQPEQAGRLPAEADLCGCS